MKGFLLHYFILTCQNVSPQEVSSDNQGKNTCKNTGCQIQFEIFPAEIVTKLRILTVKT